MMVGGYRPLEDTFKAEEVVYSGRAALVECLQNDLNGIVDVGTAEAIGMLVKGWPEEDPGEQVEVD